MDPYQGHKHELAKRPTKPRLAGPSVGTTLALPAHPGRLRRGRWHVCLRRAPRQITRGGASRTAGHCVCAFFGALSELWQFPFSSLFLPSRTSKGHTPATPATPANGSRGIQQPGQAVGR